MDRLFTSALQVGITCAVALAQDRPLLITGARILDPSAEKFLEGQEILIEGGRIRKVHPRASEGVTGLIQTLSLDSLFLLPGLIDLHTHLLLHPYDEAPWNDQVLKESLELRTIRGVAAGRAHLEAGFTTLRELGTEGAGFADVALRDAFEQGIVPGPRLFATTRAIVATGCYGPAGFDPRWEVPQGAQEATGPDEVRMAVREQIAAGADWIKVYADYRRRPGAAATPTFSAPELEAIIDEARSAGIKVAAHATTDEGIRRAVLAGAATIEHGYGATRETLALMVARGTVLCPTLSAVEATARYSGWKPGTPEPRSLRQARETFTLALSEGVTIACGSDAGVFAHGSSARELELMVAAGMSPAQALRSATSVAARVLDQEDDLGRIARGAWADLVVVPEDPLREFTALRRPKVVMKAGQVMIDRR